MIEQNKHNSLRTNMLRFAKKVAAQDYWFLGSEERGLVRIR